MSLDPLFADGAIVTAHAFAAFAALLLGASQLVLEQRGLRHKTVGYVWVALMGLVAVSSFWIHGFRLIGPFSPIHLLSLYVLVNMFIAIRAARRRDFKTHRSAMRSMFFFGLIVAGAFTFIPGRAMFLVITG